MTQQQITDIKAANAEVCRLIGRNSGDTSQLRLARSLAGLLSADCDHTHPDGASAIDCGTIICKSCDICRWNDL